MACITGSVDQELLRRNEYLVTENRLLRQQITGRIQLSDAERKTLKPKRTFLQEVLAPLWGSLRLAFRPALLHPPPRKSKERRWPDASG